MRFKPGDKARVIGNTNGHYFQPKEEVEIIEHDKEWGYLAKLDHRIANWVLDCDLEPISPVQEEESLSPQLIEALEALCDMWNQYCGGPTGHMFMSAGEAAQEVLSKYGLLKNETMAGGEVDYDKLEKYKSQIEELKRKH